MSDFYGAQWGPGGPGGEQAPPQLWPFGDQGPIDPALHLQFDVADTLERMRLEQQLAAERYAGAGPAAGTVIEPGWAGRPAAASTPPALNLSVPAESGEGLFAPGGAPRDVPFGERGLPSVPAARAVREPAGVGVWPEDQYRPGGGTVALAVLGVGTLIALAAVTSGGESNKPEENPARQAAPPAAAAPAPEGYTCAVTGVKELSPYTGSVTLSATAGGRAVWVGNNVQADVASPADTTFTFDASNMHSQTVTVSVGNTQCEGSFNLGQVGAGDETFRGR
jgi:hypothetical protein